MADAADPAAMPPAPGMTNLGGTCYLSATVQALAHCASAVRTLILSPAARRTKRTHEEETHADDGRADDKEVKERRSVRVAIELRSTLIALWSRAARPIPQAVSPTGLLWSLAPAMALQGIFRMREENDAHELYSVLSDELCEAGDPEVVVALSGETQQIVRCEACGATSIGKPEPFTSLALEIPPAKAAATASVSAMLAASLAPERLEGYRCDACHPRRRRQPEESEERAATTTAARFCTIWRLPSILVLVVKRFVASSPDGNDEEEEEVDRSPVTVPIALGRDVISRVIAPKSPHAAASSYRLCAAVCHMGSPRRGGHYVALTRRPSTGSWHLHDDEHTFPIESFETFQQGHLLRTAYMLFYERVGRGV